MGFTKSDLKDWDIWERKWKPEYEGEYYVPTPSDQYLFTRRKWLCDNEFDNHAYKNNIVFKTAEEAIEAAEKMIKALEGGLI